MTELPKDGGPAFPAKRAETVQMVEGMQEYAIFDFPGMSLRDWFAGQALMMLAPPEFLMSDDMTNSNLKGVAVRAFRIADAMLEARGK